MKTPSFFLKVFILFILSAMVAGNIQAQAPEGFSYQAVIRDASGEISAETAANLRFSIIEKEASGTDVYRETVDVTTNEFGLVSHNIGTGKVDLGVFSEIDWSNESKFLKVEVSLNNSPYVDLGTTQLMSVPYAKHATTATMAKSTEKNASVGGTLVVSLPQSGIAQFDITLNEAVPGAWVGGGNHVALVSAIDARDAVCVRAGLTNTTNLRMRIENRSGKAGTIRLNYIILPI